MKKRLFTRQLKRSQPSSLMAQTIQRIIYEWEKQAIIKRSKETAFDELEPKKPCGTQFLDYVL
jgi:hypothetical protein